MLQFTISVTDKFITNKIKFPQKKKTYGHYWFRFQHVKSLEIITPVHPRKSWKTENQLLFLNLRTEGKSQPPNLERQVYPEMYSNQELLS